MKLQLPTDATTSLPFKNELFSSCIIHNHHDVDQNDNSRICCDGETNADRERRGKIS